MVSAGRKLDLISRLGVYLCKYMKADALLLTKGSKSLEDVRMWHRNSGRVCSIPLTEVPAVAVGAEESLNLHFLGLFPPQLGVQGWGDTQLCIHGQIEYENQLIKALWSLNAILVFTHRICVKILQPHYPECKKWDLRHFKYVQIYHSSLLEGLILSFLLCSTLLKVKLNPSQKKNKN